VICPVCKTKSIDSAAPYCLQCGVDLHVHYLLNEIGAMLPPADVPIPPEPEARQKFAWLLDIGQIGPTILLITVCTIFGFFLELRFLVDLKRHESHQTLSAIIQQELNLIQDLYRDNRVLQAKIQTLNIAIPKPDLKNGTVNLKEPNVAL